MNNKQGTLSWNLLAVTVIALLVLVVLLIFANEIRDKAIEAFKFLIQNVFGG